MENCFELSSDSNSPSVEFQVESKINDSFDINSIIKKYKMDGIQQVPTFSKLEIISSSDDELPTIKTVQTGRKTTQTKTHNRTLTQLKNKYSAILEDDSQKQWNMNSRKRKITPSRKAKKAVAVASSAKRQEKIAKIKAQVETEKILKRTVAEKHKELNPDEQLKIVTVLIDSNLIDDKYGDQILSHLQENNISFKIQTNTISNSVMWTRGGDARLETNPEIERNGRILLILNWDDLLQYISTDTLITHIKSRQSVDEHDKLSLCIYKLEEYFKYQQLKEKRNFKATVSETSARSTKADKKYELAPDVSKNKIENALVELQLLCSCSYHLVDTPADLALLIYQYTKAIATLSSKLKKQQTEAEEFVSEDNRDVVTVDKRGNGLQRLWQQQLTNFPLVRLETADAIVSKYPTPRSLINAYANFTTDTEGAHLLQDIPVVRGVGPYMTTTKIGPELSKKVHTFFTSVDGNITLNTQ